MKDYSVILAVFKRNGDEGEFTKIVTSENFNDFNEPLSLIEKDEKPLICYKKDELHWLLLTDRRVLQQYDNVQTILQYSEIVHVTVALEEERKVNQKSKAFFTMLEVEAVSGEKFIVRTEPGKPYFGIWNAIKFARTGTKEK